MYIYEQRSGLWLADTWSVACYSGFGEHRNRPESEKLAGLGPIPRGAYWIGPEEDSDVRGPVMMRLTPVIVPEAIRRLVPGAVGTVTHGRDNFELHGDSRSHPGAASHGCIVMDRPHREQVADHPDRLLVVVSGDKPRAPPT